MSTASGRPFKVRVWDVEQSQLLAWEDIWYSVCRMDGRAIGSPEPEVFFPFITMALAAPAFKYVVDQFTGLQDSKSQDIYEGDIVRIQCPGGGDFEDTVGSVFWYDGRYLHGNTEGRPGKALWKYATVIGNVHQNPELLSR